MTRYRSLDFIANIGQRVGEDGSVWTRWKKHSGGRWTTYSLGRTWIKVEMSSQAMVYLRVSGGRKLHSVARLVLSAFVGTCPPGMEACHFPDRDRTNNNLWNLRWDTHKNNLADRKAHGTDPSGERNPFYGKKHTEETRKKIREAIRGKCSGENNSFFGRTHSEETKRKISEAAIRQKRGYRGRYCS